MIQLTRWLRQLYIWLGSGKEDPVFLVDFALLMGAEEIWSRLWQEGWGINEVSHIYKHQILSMRKPAPPRHQYHLRVYEENGIEWVTAHYEVDVKVFPLEHLKGIDLRSLTPIEKEELRNLMTRSQNNKE